MSVDSRIRTCAGKAQQISMRGDNDKASSYRKEQCYDKDGVGVLGHHALTSTDKVQRNDELR
uniref:Uncharacterized protein n=1 Tax=Oryza punctata TaxID=4537 RepID=A0A0E0L2S6_ORYPU